MHRFQLLEPLALWIPEQLKIEGVTGDNLNLVTSSGEIIGELLHEHLCPATGRVVAMDYVQDSHDIWTDTACDLISKEALS